MFFFNFFKYKYKIYKKKTCLKKLSNYESFFDNKKVKIIKKKNLPKQY